MAAPSKKTLKKDSQCPNYPHESAVGTPSFTPSLTPSLTPSFTQHLSHTIIYYLVILTHDFSFQKVLSESSLLPPLLRLLGRTTRGGNATGGGEALALSEQVL